MTQPPPPDGPQQSPPAPGPGAGPPPRRHIGQPWPPPPGTAGPRQFGGYAPAPQPGWASGSPPPYPPPQQPFPPPRGPRPGMIVGTVLGIVTILVVIGAAVLLTVAAETDSPSSNSAVGHQTVAPGVPTGETANAADAIAIRSAMQIFVDAVNSRDVARIQASVCSALRPQVTMPLDITGTVVLDELTDITVTGDSAASTVSTHVELGNQRSLTKQNDESFAREDGTWYVCPGAQLDIGT
ncbi:MAG: hypothetical protein SW127_07065 [Actinomycetota bacterium]|nr:hypothetical protein [Actinomycetota bacterium]